MHGGIDSGSHEIAGREVLVSVDDPNGRVRVYLLLRGNLATYDVYLATLCNEIRFPN